MLSFTDQTGRPVQLSHYPRKIVSLVPSVTELLYHLELEAEVVGITKFCVHPPHWFRGKKRVGGTKAVHPRMVQELQPDLILANKEENVKEQVEALANDFPVWVGDVSNLQQALEMIIETGALTNRQAQARVICETIRTAFDKLPPARPLKTAYLIWQAPYMSVGHDTFIHDMLLRCGLENMLAQHTRYPTITLESLRDEGCELLLLASEPFPFAEKHRAAIQAQLPHTKVILADGEMFSWYGSRLREAPAYFHTLLEQAGAY